MGKSSFSVFLDDGGVMNDNRARGLNWQKLVGDFFIPKFGGSYEQWSAANIKAVDYEIKLMDQIIAVQPHYSYAKFSKIIQPAWIETMFRDIGIPIPTKEECEKLAVEAMSWITPQAHSMFPGVVETINQLSWTYNLYTASNEDSSTLQWYLSGMGILDSFVSPKFLFGPDLVDQFKSHESYFTTIFAYVDIAPEQAIIVEDNPMYVKYAEKSGAKVVQSRIDPVHPLVTKYSIRNMVDLPQTISSLIEES
ncbi:MAG: HAD hydrolase-like protein [Candidatus Kariarchaeaceae archaeon]